MNVNICLTLLLLQIVFNCCYLLSDSNDHYLVYSTAHNLTEFVNYRPIIINGKTPISDMDLEQNENGKQGKTNVNRSIASKSGHTLESEITLEAAFGCMPVGLPCSKSN